MVQLESAAAAAAAPPAAAAVAEMDVNQPRRQHTNPVQAKEPGSTVKLAAATGFYMHCLHLMYTVLLCDALLSVAVSIAPHFIPTTCEQTSNHYFLAYASTSHL
jgi:hypothetical protein